MGHQVREDNPPPQIKSDIKVYVTASRCLLVGRGLINANQRLKIVP